MRHIFRCGKCGAYTMKEKCGCGGKAETTKPPKYSPDDRFSEYRRKAKRSRLESEGLL
jgi:H/ACA ribonucleoprotein complex subunit 3